MSRFLKIAIFGILLENLLFKDLAFSLQARTKPGDYRPVCDCGKSEKLINPRVVGGHDAALGEFPYATGILRSSRLPQSEQWRHSYQVTPYCGGTLITDKHVLTAAHCVRGATNQGLSLDIGDYDIKKTSESKLIRRSQLLISHPDYYRKAFRNDIAIIELNQPVVLGDRIKAAWLPPRNIEIRPGTKVAVYGWGRLSYEGGGRPNILQSADLPVVSKEMCQKKFVTRITDDMLCAGGNVGHDACIGDSGSGLTARIGNENVLFGVVSFGKRCALPHVAGVYTKVSHYVDWIYDNTKTASCQPCVASVNDFM